MTTLKDKLLNRIEMLNSIYSQKAEAQLLAELVVELDEAFEAVYDAAPMYHGTKTDYVNSNELHRKIAKEARGKIQKWVES